MLQRTVSGILLSSVMFCLNDMNIKCAVDKRVVVHEFS